MAKRKTKSTKDLSETKANKTLKDLSETKENEMLADSIVRNSSISFLSDGYLKEKFSGPPKIKTYPPMYKDAGAGIVKFFKVTAQYNEDGCRLVTKAGRLGEEIVTSQELFDNFSDACKAAEDAIAKKSVRGYKVKIKK